MGTSVGAPVSGTTVPLSAVGDPVFSELMVGHGLAIEPDAAGRVSVCSPISGQIVASQPHAFAVKDAAGNTILVHLGLDTVELEGEPFQVVAGKGSSVAAGERIVDWDVAKTLTAGFDCTVIVTALQVVDQAATSPAVISDLASGHVDQGDCLFTVV